MGLTMLVMLHGVYLASLPPGVPVSSRGDCVSRCFLQGNCSSVFYDDSAKKCQLSADVFRERDLTSSSNSMQYLEFQIDDCDKGYTWYRSLGLCYKIYNSTETWFQANLTCHQDGGHLIKVDSSGINALMNKISDSHSADIWLGGFQEHLGGTWTWTDGSVIGPAYWDDSQPDSVAEKCLVVDKQYTDVIHRWHDYSCTYNGIPMFVCHLQLKEETYC
ncbi:C-type lectin BPL-like [Haliotis asinina]|uniref:C-type lectin BPL-like n=1 Tax=Haliotis asinina TaxID=109174 RepID=UPI00353226B1